MRKYIPVAKRAKHAKKTTKAARGGDLRALGVKRVWGSSYGAEGLGLGSRALRTGLAGTLACTMAFPVAALADEDDGVADSSDAAVSYSQQESDAYDTSGPESGLNKSETVYVKADAAGAKQGVYVVNKFNTGKSEQVSDPANYESVKNLSSTEDIEQKDGSVELTTLAGEPFYYQGDLDASTELPWDITVRYYLDGVEKTPEEMQGVSGEVRVVLDVQTKASEDADDDADGDAAGEGGATDDGLSDFADSYLVQATGTFPEDTFTITDAGDATVAHAGSSATVACMVMPGTSTTFEIVGQAHEFSYDGWQVAAMSLGMAIDLAEQDTSELSDATGELKDATSQLADGADELTDGASEVDSGAGELTSGAQSLSSGASQLDSGASSLAAGAADAASGAQSLSAGLNSLVSGSAQYISALQGARQDSSAAQASLGSAQSAYASALANAYSAAASGDAAAQSSSLAALDAAAQALAEASGQYYAAYGANQAIDQALAGYTSLDAGIADAASGAANLSSGTASLSSGAASLSSGAASLSDGAGSLSAGTQSLASGTSQLASGSRELADGATELADSVSGMDDEILDEMQSLIDEKLGADFQPHSFVVSENTAVDDVEFVYVIDGVSAPDDEEDAEGDGTGDADAEESDEGIIDRLFALLQPKEE